MLIYKKFVFSTIASSIVFATSYWKNVCDNDKFQRPFSCEKETIKTIKHVIQKFSVTAICLIILY